MREFGAGRLQTPKESASPSRQLLSSIVMATHKHVGSRICSTGKLMRTASFDGGVAVQQKDKAGRKVDSNARRKTRGRSAGIELAAQQEIQLVHFEAEFGKLDSRFSLHWAALGAVLHPPESRHQGKIRTGIAQQCQQPGDARHAFSSRLGEGHRFIQRDVTAGSLLEQQALEFAAVFRTAGVNRASAAIQRRAGLAKADRPVRAILAAHQCQAECLCAAGFSLRTELAICKDDSIAAEATFKAECIQA